MKSKLVLLTGFLGAGKTTFLNHILHEYEDAKVGLIVNEFSQTGVDGALIRQDIPGAKMIELNNGSIFCACIKDSFTDSLVEMGSKDLEYVFVEASGLADPSSIVSILDQIRDIRKVEYVYEGSICLCDAVQFPKHSKVLISLQRQVIHARAVILNKCDLVDEEGIKTCEEAIRAIKADVPVYRTSYSKVSLKEILSSDKQEEAASEESTNTTSSRPVTVTLRTTEIVDEKKLCTFLDAIGGSTFRIKGFMRTTEGTREVSMVGLYREMKQWPIVPSESQLVIISSVGVKIISLVVAAAKDCFAEPYDLK